MDPSIAKGVTWRFQKKDREFSPKLYSISRTEGNRMVSFHEDATLEFDWGSGEGNPDPAMFLWWRLTGTDPNVFAAKWDSEGQTKMRLPKSVKVTGLPEAVGKFSWPK